MASWKFTASPPIDPEYRFNVAELELWDRLQTNSRRALFRLRRYRINPHRSDPRYDLVNRLQRELGWGQMRVYQTWWSMKNKCQAYRRKNRRREYPLKP